MTYSEITVRTTAQAADIVAQAFFELGGSGVCIADKNDLLELAGGKIIWDFVDGSIEDKFDPHWVLVKGFVEYSTTDSTLSSLECYLDNLKHNSAGVMDVGPLEVTYKHFDGADIETAWKRHFRPVTVKNIAVCPKWIKPPKGFERQTVLIDPGMAFGTGEHQTTRLCVELMQKIPLEGKIVADIGCGSGVLGLCALKLGAAHVYMSDFDQSAVAAAVDNARLNALYEKCTVTHRDLLHDADFKADAVFINIVAEVLIAIAPQLYRVLNSEAHIVLSGIVKQRLKSVQHEYEIQGYKQLSLRQSGEWFALLYKKQSTS